MFGRGFNIPPFNPAIPGAIGGTTPAAGAFTTVDATNIEATNIKAKDGTAAGSIADSTGVVSLSSVVLTTVDINAGTLDSVTVGATTPGAVYSVSQVTTHSATEAASAASMYGNDHLITGAYVVTLPTAVLGMTATFETTTAAAASLDCAGTDLFILSGIALTAGYKITCDAAAGNKVKVVCKQATKWHVVDTAGAWIDGGA